MNPWELHPALVHFPLAFLLGAVLAEIWTSRRPHPTLHLVANTIAFWGVVLGWATAVAGVVAWLTLPAHSDSIHSTMLVHGGLASTGLVAFTASVLFTRRGIAPVPSRWLARAGAILLISAGVVGGRMVYRGGAGISADHEAAVAPHNHPHSH